MQMYLPMQDQPVVGIFQEGFGNEFEQALFYLKNILTGEQCLSGWTP